MLTQIIEGRESNILTIELMLGNLCNYKCSYCFPGSNEGTHLWPDTDLLIKNITHLFETYKKHGKNKFELTVLGGEPTLWKDLPKFCKFLKSNYNTAIRIATNGYRKPEWWKENSKLFDSIEISVHSEFANPEHIKQVGDTLYLENTNVVANVLMNPYEFDKCVSVLEEIKKSKYKWPIIGKSVHYNGLTRYSEEQKKYLKDPLKRWPDLEWWSNLNYNEEYETWIIENNEKKKVSYNYFSLEGKNKFKGWECNLGVDHLRISMTGKISGNCDQLLYGENFYFNLYEENFSLLFNPKIVPVICASYMCKCGFENNISKRIISIKEITE
jgi:organic radical activating enzyme